MKPLLYFSLFSMCALCTATPSRKTPPLHAAYIRAFDVPNPNPKDPQVPLAFDVPNPNPKDPQVPLAL
jgi:hypothetical protein